MGGLKVLSGTDVVAILGKFGFLIHSQHGSHVKLRRALPDGTRQTLTIALHSEMDRGTLRAIYRQAARYIAVSELRSHFYTD